MAEDMVPQRSRKLGAHRFELQAGSRENTGNVSVL